MRFILTLIILFALGTAANGYENPKPLTGVEVSVGPDYLPAFSAASRSYFGHGEQPPCGSPKFVWLPSEKLDAITGVKGALGASVVPQCTIYFQLENWKTTTPGEICRVIAHEMGHLYGRAHTDRPNDVMNYRMTWSEVDPCRSIIEKGRK